jgi:hypothetical protein
MMGISAGPDMVQDGLVLNLDLTDRNSYVPNSNTWNDVSGRNNHFTLYNTPTYSSDFKGTLTFDGTNDYMASTNTVPDLAFNGTSLTFSLFMSISENFATERIVVEYGPTGYNGYYQITFFPTSTTFRTLGQNGYNVWFDTSWNFTPGQIYNTVLTYNYSTGFVGFYLNGLLYNSSTRTGTSLSTPQRLFVFSRNGSTLYQKGQLFNIMAYNKSLSAQEINQNYNALKSRFNL